MTRNKNGIPNLTRGYFEETKKGCNSANCPPPRIQPVPTAKKEQV